MLEAKAAAAYLKRQRKRLQARVPGDKADQVEQETAVDDYVRACLPCMQSKTKARKVAPGFYRSAARQSHFKKVATKPDKQGKKQRAAKVRSGLPGRHLDIRAEAKAGAEGFALFEDIMQRTAESELLSFDKLQLLVPTEEDAKGRKEREGRFRRPW